MKSNLLLNSSLIVLSILSWLYATNACASDSAFNPIPKITNNPSNPSVNWLSQVYAHPEKYGMDEWQPVKSSLTDSSLLIAYTVDFVASYPVDINRLIDSTPKLKVNWIKPRVRQSLSLQLWNQEVTGDLKKESPWITPGRLTFTLVNFVYECAIPQRIYIVDLTTMDVRSKKRLQYRLDNEMLAMDYTNSWSGVCEVGR